jgi:hypothetical protein
LRGEDVLREALPIYATYERIASSLARKRYLSICADVKWTETVENVGGVLLVEPQLTPEVELDGHLGAVFVDQPTLKIARLNRNEVAGTISVLHSHYLVATPEGIEHFTERHELGLFSHQEYLAPFGTSGLEVSYEPDPKLLSGRGVYTGVRP